MYFSLVQIVSFLLIQYILLLKSFDTTLAQHPMLVQINPDRIIDHFHVQVCELWANIPQVIFLCNVGKARSGQHFIGVLWQTSHK